MGKYCGNSIPPSHVSSINEILIHFEADYYNGNNNGFKMEYNPTGKQNTSIQNNTEYFSSFQKIFEHRVQLIILKLYYGNKKLIQLIIPTYYFLGHFLS